MSDNPGKSFKVPKIRKDNKDGLREVDINGRDAREITHIVQRSYIENGYKPQWQLKTVQYVQNRQLEERYRQKRSEMKDEGRNARDLGEQHTFLLFRDVSLVPRVAKEGLKCRSLPFNALGNSKLGLYLSRNADVQLRLAENWESMTCVMVIFKITPGKCKVLLSGSDGGEGMEPTPNYDCHVSQHQPRSCDPIHLQLARSQIYLYEYTEDCEPSESPRQCLPYAVLTYEKSQNMPQTSQIQSDSYSKRPTPIADRLRTDQNSSDADQLSNKVETISTGDPRLRRKDSRQLSSETPLNLQDPRLAYIQQQGGDLGLCVPRLTPGPPPSSTGPLNFPGSTWSKDPRLSQIISAYQPSFGPQFGINHFNQPPPQSLLQPQPAQPPLMQQAVQNMPSLPPNDPRLRRNDPRLDSRLRDPRLQKPDSDMRSDVMSDVNNVPKPSAKSKQISNENSNKLRKKLSLTDYKQKVGIQPIAKSDASQDDDSDQMYDPSNPTMVQDIPHLKQTQDENDELNKSGDQDAVDNPDDMMKALNELSDPEDESQSPKTIADEVEGEDPVLAAAMRKLVEHSGDMALFTEALGKLQESAEELGDALHDPSFLVKAIAQIMESLTRNTSVEEKPEENKSTIHSSDVSHPMTSQTQVINMEIDPPSPRNNSDMTPPVEDSPMARAMKRTLEELKSSSQVPEQSVDTFNGDSFNNNNAFSSESMEIASIPTPKDKPPEPNKAKTNVERSINLEDIPLPEAKPRQTDIDIMETATHKPHLSFSLKKTRTVTVGVPNLFQDDENKEINEEQDKDERQNSQDKDERQSSRSRQKGNDGFENIKTSEMEPSKHFEIMDTDYRMHGKGRYLGFPIDMPQSSKPPIEISEQGITTPESSNSVVNLLIDKDDRQNDSNTPLMDKDDRHRPFSTKSSSVIPLEDKDERHLIPTLDEDRRTEGRTEIEAVLDMFDKDERTIRSNIPNIEDPLDNSDPSLLDKDERRSHSRSQSPPNVSQPFMDRDDRMITKMEVIEPPEMRTEVDKIRSRSASPTRSASPLSANEEPSTTDVKIIPLHNLDEDGSQSSSDSGLFDAYSLGKKAGKEQSDKSRQQVENEFGDVDWRLAAEAAEMGDVDLRASQSASQSVSQSASLSSLHSVSQSTLQPGLPSESQSSLQSEPQSVLQSASQYSLQSASQSSSQSTLSQDDGDVDLRESGSDLQSVPPENFDSQSSSNYMSSEYRVYHDTSNMQPMFGMQSSSIQPAGSYSTNRVNLEAFTSYKVPIPSYSTSTSYGGEYRSGGFPGRTYGDQYAYSTGGRGNESYSTGGGIPGLEQYSTTNRNMNQAVPPGIGGLGSPGPGVGLQNLMNNLNFSSLKNILASVQNSGAQGGPPFPAMPMEGPLIHDQPQQPNDSGALPDAPKTNPDDVDDDDERENQPAFCTGLSFLKSKQPKVDMSRAKYTGLARQNDKNQTIKSPKGKASKKKAAVAESYQKTGDQDSGKFNNMDEGISDSEQFRTVLPGFDPPQTDSSGIIPGFGSTRSGGIPGLGMLEESDVPGSSKPFTFSQDIPERDFKSEWYEDSKKSDKAEGKSKTKSPKKKSKRNRAGNSSSEHTESWQLAILESMEQSALAVKSDDSIAMETEHSENEPQVNEPPVNEPEFKLPLVAEPRPEEGKSAIQEENLERDDTRVTEEPDSDEEEDGLVIDLDMSQTSKESEKHTPVDDNVMTIEDENSNDKLDKADKDKTTIGRDTPVQDEKDEDRGLDSTEGGNNTLQVLEGESERTPSTNEELKSFIEKKRKNIVIKLKGETKIVNPKTGKAYTENMVGSAIEVLGQSKKPASSPSVTPQQVHPMPANQSDSNKNSFQGKSISTLINRSVVPKSSNQLSQNTVNTGTNLNLQNQSVKEYTHPYTGQKVQYPVMAASQSQQPSPPLTNQFLGTTNYQRNSGMAPNNFPLPSVQKVLVLPGQGGIGPLLGQGMSIPTIGVQPSQPLHTTDNEQFDGASTQSFGNVSVKNEKNYELSNTSANKYIKTDVNPRKRNVNDTTDSGSDQKKIKVETSDSNINVKVLTDQSEPSTSVTKTTDDETKKNDDDSELEDGEISDDDDDLEEHPSRHDNRESGQGRSSDSRFNMNRSVPRHPYEEYSRRHEYRKGDSWPHRAGSEWSDLLHHPEMDHIERRPSHKSIQQRLGSKSDRFTEDANSVLSKSAATFSKAKQKMLARNQVKTLGDWLKVELEIDNIEPLQDIIPYSLDADLSIIPKQRRRKIRLKVKNAIEQEGNRQSNFELSHDPEAEMSAHNLSYSPEVSHDQIDRELGMVRDVMLALNRPLPARRSMPVLLNHEPLIADSYEETLFRGALALVENEMITLLNRTNYVGYPHRRVPQDLLLDSEMNSFRSAIGDVFLILMSPISLKAHNRLTQAKIELEDLYRKKEKAKDSEAIELEIKSHLIQRQNLLRSFTGYLNKKRVTKLQELSEHFTMVYNFFKSQVPPFPDGAVKFIRTTQMDVRQHLLVAKHYMAMEEKRLEIS